MAKVPASKKSTQKSPWDSKQVIEDYRIAYLSRQVSIIGRKEVLTGKAKFGIFGDGKEIAQIAMAKAFQPGDWRAGYYRDQTFMFALQLITVRQYFAQLYADPDPEREPASSGRQMNAHFATRFISQDGDWLNQLTGPNVSADASPTASQMPRLLGLAYASKLYRHVKDLKSAAKKFSHEGNEIAFGTIGDASTSEGIFWESLNAAGVLQVPLLMSVWDDGYGISVPKSYQTIKESISEALAGFHPQNDQQLGLRIHKVKGWDYPSLLDLYQKVANQVRSSHQPALIHVEDCTQPQGHSTSGSHERYKSVERLEFESEMDGLRQMRKWMLAQGIADESHLEQLESDTLDFVRKEQQQAWSEYIGPAERDRQRAVSVLQEVDHETYGEIIQELKATSTIRRRDVHRSLRRARLLASRQNSRVDIRISDLELELKQSYQGLFSTYLHNQSLSSPLEVPAVEIQYAEQPEMVPASQVLQKNFEALFARDPRMFAIGEDVGKLGDVNRGMDGIQERFGELRCTDTGIREATILGQGIGAAMRGLRPIVDIQYLDYVHYCFQGLSDDLATLHYRSAGAQLAPVIVRTRGHRLEGVWHTGSPMGVLVHGCRGIHICVPRNMTQAAGMYNTLMRGEDPALVVEVLNGYRLREPLPANLGEFCIPLGVPEILQEGSDVTIVSYGATLRVCSEALSDLEALGISAELIDVQCLLPLDRHRIIANSVAKTHALMVVDEDVPGGAGAYILNAILNEHGAYGDLDAQPQTLAASPHRSAFGSDADYYSKPSVEDVVESVLKMMQERQPEKFKGI